MATAIMSAAGGHDSSTVDRAAPGTDDFHAASVGAAVRHLGLRGPLPQGCAPHAKSGTTIVASSMQLENLMGVPWPVGAPFQRASADTARSFESSVQSIKRTR